MLIIKLPKFIALFILIFFAVSTILAAFSNAATTHEEKIEELKKTLQKNPNDTETLIEIAKRYGWIKKTDLAIEYYEKVLKIDPTNLTAMRSLRDWYSWTGRRDKAIRLSEKILKLDPADLKTKEKLAFFYMWNKRPEETRVLFEEILKDNPDNFKARQGLADLYKYSARHDQAIEEYEQILETVKTPEEKRDIYRRIASTYYDMRTYEKSRRYYEELLKIDPTDKEALRGLERIEKLMQPQIYTRFDFYKAKGDETHFVQAYGINQPLKDGYKMRLEYEHDRSTERGIDRFITQRGEMEFRKDFSDTLTLSAGAAALYYDSDERIGFEYFGRIIKDITPNLTVMGNYRKRVEDSDIDALHQKVDRHSYSGSAFYDVTDYFSINSMIGGRYYTKGDAPEDNHAIEMSVSPVFHIVKVPIVDLSYTYHRLSFLRTDKNFPGNSLDRTYEYFNPGLLQTHSGTVYVRHYFFKRRLRLTFSDTFGFTREDDTEYLRNTIHASLRIKLTEDDYLTGGYYLSRKIRHLGNSYQRVEQFTIEFSHNF